MIINHKGHYSSNQTNLFTIVLIHPVLSFLLYCFHTLHIRKIRKTNEGWVVKTHPQLESNCSIQSKCHTNVPSRPIYFYIFLKQVVLSSLAFHIFKSLLLSHNFIGCSFHAKVKAFFAQVKKKLQTFSRLDEKCKRHWQRKTQPAILTVNVISKKCSLLTWTEKTALFILVEVDRLHLSALTLFTSKIRNCPKCVYH